MIISKEVLAPGIVLYKTDLSKVKAIKDNLEPAIDNRWRPAQGVNTDTHENEISTARKCFDFAMDKNILLGNDESAKQLFRQTEEWIEECVRDFRNMYSIERLTEGPYIYLKYEDSDKFDWHIDDGKKYPRTVSVSAYLNDDYEGGEIEFDHFGISHKPSAGDVVVFSSAFPYLHRVTPTKNGTRYAVVNWYRYAGYPSVME